MMCTGEQRRFGQAFGVPEAAGHSPLFRDPSEPPPERAFDDGQRRLLHARASNHCDRKAQGERVPGGKGKRHRQQNELRLSAVPMNSLSSPQSTKSFH